MRWLLMAGAVGVFAVVTWQAGWLSASDPLQAAPALILLVLLFFVAPAVYVYLDARKRPEFEAATEFLLVLGEGMYGLRSYLNRRDELTQSESNAPR